MPSASSLVKRCLQRLLVLNGAGLLHVERLLVVGQLALQFVHFQLGRFGARLVFGLLLARLGHHFVLLFQTVGQLFQIGFIAFDLLLLTHRRLHQIQVVAGGLVIGFQIGFGAALFAQLARHFHMAILFGGQLLAAAQQIAAQRQRAVQMDAAFVGVAHIVRRHIGGGLGDQMLEQVAIRLGDADCFQRHAVFAQRRFHVLERLAHAAVFRQQVIAQRAGDGAGDTTVQRRFNQTVEFAAIGGRTQTFRDHAQIEHQRVVIGDGVKLLELHALHLFHALFQLLQRQHARLAIAHGLGQQFGRLYRGRQALDGERFDVDLTIAPCHLLQAHTDHHALVARVDDVEGGVTHAGTQLAVQAFVARTAGGARFGGVTEVQQRQVGDQCGDEGRHGGGLPRPVTAGQRGHQLIQIKGTGEETVPVNQRQRAKFTAFNHSCSSSAPSGALSTC